MSRYPDWVNAFKEKGTSVKKVGNEYYLYKATSRRVPGKKYPQPVEKYIGVITKEGVVASGIRKVSTDRVRVFEYGMSYAMQALLPKAFLINSHDEAVLRAAFLHVVRSVSPRSYLLRDATLPDPGELHINVDMQYRRYERLAKTSIEGLRPLADIYLVETRECDMLSEVSPEMAALLEEVGVSIDALQA
jgi:hypothetical protein